VSGEDKDKKSFKVVGLRNIQFCPYCGEVLSEAVDHEIFEDSKSNCLLLTSNCPERAAKSNGKCNFCPRCGENIDPKTKLEKTKHKIEILTNRKDNKAACKITCPFENTPFEVILSQGNKNKN